MTSTDTEEETQGGRPMKMEAEKGETHLQTKEHQGFLATSDASRQA